MKNKKILAIIIAFLLTAFFAVNAQNKSNSPNEQKLMRTWKLDKSILPMLIDEIIQNNPEASLEKEKLENMLETTTLEYKKDNTYELNIPLSPQNSQAGTWKLAENGAKIIRENSEKEKSISKIVELSETKLIIINEKNQKIIYILAQ